MWSQWCTPEVILDTCLPLVFTSRIQARISHLTYHTACVHIIPLGVPIFCLPTQDERQPAITRSACAAYLASFLARAAFVPHSIVFQSLVYLTDFCHEYCAAAPPISHTQHLGGANIVLGSSSAVDASTTPSAANCMTTKHQVLYASVQAILYVLCYHLEALITSSSQPSQSQSQSQKVLKPEAVRALVQERVVPLLSSHLQPVNVCLPSVVTEFKHQLKALAIADITTLLPQVGPSFWICCALGRGFLIWCTLVVGV